MKTINILKATFFIFCILNLNSCDSISTPNELPEAKKSTPLAISIENIEIVGDPGHFIVEKKSVSDQYGIQIIRFSFSSESAAELQPVSIKFNFPSIDINGFWNPLISVDKVNYYSSAVTSKASSYAPVLSFYNNALQNRITIAISDAVNQSEIRSYLREEDVIFYPEIRLFKEKMPKTKYYEIDLRIDTRDLPYYKTLADVAEWWAGNPDYKPMQVPDEAKKPMYSTWYSYHQNITAEEIVAECKIAKTLGCNAVIIDDGWQTRDSNRGYAYTGDWQAERIPEMETFVEAVHAEGMQLLLWYSLPFIGENAKNYPKFKGKYLRYWNGQGTWVLDPRYPEVRKFIVNTYIQAMEQWKVDGFKLDFIGRFTADDETILTAEDGRDFASVNDATDALMTEVTSRLTELNPKILIEFRQPYIGPVMRKYGNMFRGVDAPNNAVANRIETTNLRILAGNTAVHSDMFIWRKEEPVEIAALQILNILYSVPQLSVKLAEIPDEHLDMIRYWFGYWNDHRHILLDGAFVPSNPGANYPVLSAILNGYRIITLYEEMPVLYEDSVNELDIINAKASDQIIIQNKNKRIARIRITDCMGNEVYAEQISLAAGLHEFKVPPSGMISFKRK